MSKDGTDQEQVQIDRERFELDQLNISSGLKHLMSAVTGRAWMWDLMGECGLLQTSLVPMHPKAELVLAARDAERNVAIKLWSACQEHCPNELTVMLSEGAEIQRVRNAVDQQPGKRRRRRRRKKTEASNDDRDHTDDDD